MLRRRRLYALALLVLAAACAAAWRGRRAVEERAEVALRRGGLSADEVRFSWLGPLRLTGVAGSVPGGGRLSVARVDVRWRLLGGGEVRNHITGVALEGVRVERASVSAAWPEADFDIVDWKRTNGAERLVLRERAGDGTIDVRWNTARATAAIDMTRLDLGKVDLSWNGDAAVSPGRWSGRATLDGTAGRFRSTGAFHGEAVRMTPPRALAPRHDGGAPTAMDVAWTLRGTAETVEIDSLSARLTGLDVSAHGVVRGAPDRRVDVDVKAHCDLANAFRTAGLTPPLKEARTDRFGAATLDLSMRGPLAEPASLVVEPQLRFEPEPETVHALSYLRAPFRHRPDASPGLVVEVSEGAPDFIRIDAVPPLFQRALLVSEDAGFAGHAGIDLVEIAAAWAENEEDAGRVRGASTITQQLVKNLLLTSEKTYGRKLKEAALALMVDAAVPKARLLEIYVNVIEWGPRLHGLVPAARHYFGKHPADLTPKESAFLVCLIPNPVRYHQAHAAGRMGPGMEQLVHNLLAKLRSLGELSEEEHEEALREELQFTPGCERHS